MALVMLRRSVLGQAFSCPVDTRIPQLNHERDQVAKNWLLSVYLRFEIFWIDLLTVLL